MKIDCMKCGSKAKIRTSERISNISRRLYVQCQNVFCSCAFKVMLTAEALSSDDNAIH